MRKKLKILKTGISFLILCLLSAWVGMEIHKIHLDQKYHFKNNSPIICQEKREIVFLKVHKTGGSTVTNILQRFGMSRKLNFVVPKKTPHTEKYNYIGNLGDTVTKDNIMPANNYSILCHHVIYNRSAFSALFPNQKYYYLSILRDPIDQFISTLRYFGNQYYEKIWQINASDAVHQFLNDPKQFEPPNPYLSYTNNRQSMDLGLPIQHITDDSAIRNHVQSLKEDFNLVILTEYFEESIILLKRDLCWSFKDILFIPKNEANPHYFIDLSKTDYERLRVWTKPDRMLYEAFLQIHIQKTRQEQDNFNEEVLHFKRILRMVRSYCHSFDVTAPLQIKPSLWSTGFNVSVVDCLMIKRNELQLLDKVYHDYYGIV